MLPQLYVIAGPNGIGKTTATFNLIRPEIPVINSDEIAATARKQGKDVHIFEYGDRLCARSVSPDVSDFLKAIHEQQGTQIHLDSKNLHLIESSDQTIQVLNHPQTAQVFDCVGNGQSGDLSITNTFIAASKSSRTGKWVAAPASFGTGALKCIGKCTASVSTSGKFDVVLGSGTATIAVGTKTIGSVPAANSKTSLLSGSIDVGTAKKVVRISGSNFVFLGLASVTTTLGYLKEVESPSVTIDLSLNDEKQAKLAQLGFRADDFSQEWSVLPMSGGTTLVDPSLDLCNGKFDSERDRVERRQVLALKQGSPYSFLSTEVVKYSSVAAATAAQQELVKVLAQCQIDKGYKDATGALVPYDFKPLKTIPAGVVSEGNRVFVHAVIDSGDQARSLLGFYQFNGDTFTGVYVLNSAGFSDAQVAKWLNVAVTMAKRLQQK